MSATAGSRYGGRAQSPFSRSRPHMQAGAYAIPTSTPTSYPVMSRSQRPGGYVDMSSRLAVTTTSPTQYTGSSSRSAGPLRATHAGPAPAPPSTRYQADVYRPTNLPPRQPVALPPTTTSSSPASRRRRSVSGSGTTTALPATMPVHASRGRDRGSASGAGAEYGSGRSRLETGDGRSGGLRSRDESRRAGGSASEAVPLSMPAVRETDRERREREALERQVTRDARDRRDKEKREKLEQEAREEQDRERRRQLEEERAKELQLQKEMQRERERAEQREREREEQRQQERRARERAAAAAAAPAPVTRDWSSRAASSPYDFARTPLSTDSGSDTYSRGRVRSGDFESYSLGGGGGGGGGVRGGGVVGLQNLGNTCFMNSALQCLSNCVPLREFFLDPGLDAKINTSAPTTRGELARAFRRVLDLLWSQSSERSVNPGAFKREVGRFAPQFMGYSQQDAQEFLRFLLDGLHEDLNQIRGKLPYRELEDDPRMPDAEKADDAWRYHMSRNKSFIIDLFAGQLKSTVQCSVCDNVSKAFDPFLDLSVPIPKATLSRDRYAVTSTAGAIPLSECLQEFTQAEVLDGNDKYYCSKCKKHCRSTKKLAVYRLPDVLVIHIKRFKFSASYRDKITTTITFPLDAFDMRPYCESPDDRGSLYDLFAVSNHHGGLGGGHYTAWAKNSADRRWYNFNDAHATPVDASSVAGASAYVLFYQRRA